MYSIGQKKKKKGIQEHFVVIFQIHQMKAESCNKSCQTVLTADFVATCIAVTCCDR